MDAADPRPCARGLRAGACRRQVGTADETNTAAASLTAAAQATDDPAAFTTASGSLSARPLTGARVPWTSEGWTKAGDVHRTPDLSPVLQEIVTQSDWSSGDPLVLVVVGSGERTAEFFEGGSRKAAVVHVELTR